MQLSDAEEWLMRVRRAGASVVVTALMIAGATAGPAAGGPRADGVEQTQKLVPSELTADTRFPYSIEKERRTAVAGAKWDDAGGLADSGSAYVYRRQRDGWAEQARLTSPDPVAGEEFGLAVEISRDVILVGAPYCTHDLRASNDAAADPLPCPEYVEDANRPGSGRRMLQTESDRPGRVYAFARHRGEWRHEATLSAGEDGDAFGWSLGFDRDTAVISAPWADAAGTDSGAAYVYRRHRDGSWTHEQTLVPEGLAGGDALGYGYATQVDRNTIALGAFHHDHEGLTDSGAAWVFQRRGRRGAWTETEKLVPEDASMFADFGHSVTVDHRTVLIGSPGRVADPARPFPPLPVGAAYVFERRGHDWVEQDQLLPPDPDPVTVFGVSNTLQGDTAIVVAPAKSLPTGDGALPGVGAAYVYDRVGRDWVFRERLVHDDPAPGDTIHEAELDRGTVMLGAAGKDGERGALYVFEPGRRR